MCGMNSECFHVPRLQTVLARSQCPVETGVRLCRSAAAREKAMTNWVVRVLQKAYAIRPRGTSKGISKRHSMIIRRITFLPSY